MISFQLVSERDHAQLCSNAEPQKEGKEGREWRL
jgi:hypothetical protein